MNDEKIEILSSAGSATGEHIGRNEVHQKELWHEVVHIWILDKSKNLLIQWRSQEKKQYAGVWHMSAAGHIASGEGALDTAIREVYEEIGLKILSSKFILLRRSKVEQKIPETGLMDREWVNDYLLIINDDAIEFRLQDDEVKEVKWISLENFAKEIKNKGTNRNYLNHPKSYYLDTISLIISRIK